MRYMHSWPNWQKHTVQVRGRESSNLSECTSDPVHQAFGEADGSSYLPARQERDVSAADEVLRTLGIFLERCPSGLWCRFRKPVGASPVGSNPTLSATNKLDQVFEEDIMINLFAWIITITICLFVLVVSLLYAIEPLMETRNDRELLSRQIKMQYGISDHDAYEDNEVILPYNSFGV